MDEIVLKRPSFQKITDDHRVTDDEVMEQANQVITLLKELDKTLDGSEKALVVDAMSEIAVLYQINALRGGKI